MYLIYIDESGKPNLKDPEDFVLGALIINEKDWYKIDSQVINIKKHFFPNLSDREVELHAHEITNHNGPFELLNEDDLFDLLRTCYELIANIDCCLIAIIIKKKKIYPFIIKKGKNYINNWISHWGYKLLFERICYYLEKENRKKIIKGEHIDYGIMLIDSVNDVFDKILRDKMIKWLKEGSEYANNKYLIEDPLFISSEYRNLSQLTDLIAFIVRRKFRDNSTDSIYQKNYLKYFKIIERKFDKNKHGNIFGSGIKLFPNR
ncbi:MAG: DUF3800 domain-containing protein [Promethearchaeia archaeon]